METNKYFFVIFFDDKTLVVKKTKKSKKPGLEIRFFVINWLLSCYGGNLDWYSLSKCP
jgi:hypothetical protein